MPKIAAVSALILLFGGVPVAHRSGKGLPSSLFPIPFVLESREEIGLDAEQTKATRDLALQLEAESRAIAQEVAPESEKLLKLLGPAKVDEEEALASLDKLLDLERRRKRSEILHLIRLKNLLSESQQTRLTSLRVRKGY